MVFAVLATAAVARAPEGDYAVAPKPFPDEGSATGLMAAINNQRCWDLTSSTKCRLNSLCDWDSTANICYHSGKKCSSLKKIKCKLNGMCTWSSKQCKEESDSYNLGSGLGVDTLLKRVGHCVPTKVTLQWEEVTSIPLLMSDSLLDSIKDYMAEHTGAAFPYIHHCSLRFDFGSITCANGATKAQQSEYAPACESVVVEQKSNIVASAASAWDAKDTHRGVSSSWTISAADQKPLYKLFEDVYASNSNIQDYHPSDQNCCHFVDSVSQKALSTSQHTDFLTYLQNATMLSDALYAAQELHPSLIGADTKEALVSGIGSLTAFFAKDPTWSEYEAATARFGTCS